MSQDNNGYLLPDVVEPEGFLCIRLYVPNERNYRLAFAGQLEELTKWYTWERNEAHTAKAVADFLKPLLALPIAQLAAVEDDCGIMDVRQDPENPCILQKSEDGETWVNFANLRLCVPYLRRNPANGEFEYSVDDIDWFRVPDGPWTEDIPDPVYPPPRPWSGETETDARCLAAANAEVVLHATYNETSDYLSLSGSTPIDIGAGIIALIATALVSTVSLLFVAPIVGLMIAAGVVFMREEWGETETDAIRDKLYCLATVDAEDVVTFDFDEFYDWVNSQGTAPYAGLRFLLDIITEDGLNAAGGTNSLDTADCSSADCIEEWCITYDFLTSQQGWGFYDGADCNPDYPNATWVSGEGFVINVLGGAVNGLACYISKALGGAFNITEMSVEFNIGNSGTFNVVQSTCSGPITNYSTSQNYTTYGIQTRTVTGLDVDAIRTNVEIWTSIPAGSKFGRIRSVTLKGTGEGPTGSAPC